MSQLEIELSSGNFPVHSLFYQGYCLLLITRKWRKRRKALGLVPTVMHSLWTGASSSLLFNHCCNPRLFLSWLGYRIAPCTLLQKKYSFNVHPPLTSKRKKRQVFKMHMIIFSHPVQADIDQYVFSTGSQQSRALSQEWLTYVFISSSGWWRVLPNSACVNFASLQKILRWSGRSGAPIINGSWF